MKKGKWMALVLAVTLCIGSASAHPGRTDANGGHYNHSTGEYHYHHGYPAHQHTDGVCPYDYDDRTGWNSGSSSQEKGLYYLDGTPVERKEEKSIQERLDDMIESGGDSQASNTAEPEQEKPKNQIGGLIALGAFVTIFFVLPLLSAIIEGISWHREKRKKRVKQEPQALPKPKPTKRTPVQPPMRTISKEEREHMIQADAYREMCGGRSIRKMAGVPEDVYFDTFDRPNTLNRDPPEDPFFVYVTKKGESYHLRTCRLAKNASPMNICQAMAEGKQPCKLCRPMEKLPDFAVRYRELKRIQREYGVYMLP